MGMIANYQQITDQQLGELKSDRELFETFEGLQENDELDLCDIDKIWDALHFILTKKSAAQPIENDLISEAIVGTLSISDLPFRKSFDALAKQMLKIHNCYFMGFSS
jgi:hypothetical protein